MAESIQASGREIRVAGLVTALLLLITLPLPDMMPVINRYLFCMPPAYLTAGFLGANCELTGAGVRVAGLAAMHVTLACSPIKFFLLTFALFAGLAVARRVSLRTWLWLVPAAYGITLVANTSRLILCWYGDVLTRHYFPAQFHIKLHLLIGMFVFLPVLIVAYEFIQRRIRHA